MGPRYPHNSNSPAWLLAMTIFVQSLITIAQCGERFVQRSSWLHPGTLALAAIAGNVETGSDGHAGKACDHTPVVVYMFHVCIYTMYVYIFMHVSLSVSLWPWHSVAV